MQPGADGHPGERTSGRADVGGWKWKWNNRREHLRHLQHPQLGSPDSAQSISVFPIHLTSLELPGEGVRVLARGYEACNLLCPKSIYIYYPYMTPSSLTYVQPQVQTNKQTAKQTNSVRDGQITK
jgi:hypothetical protein